MKTTTLLQQVDIPRHKLYYLEQKGYITPRRIPMGDLDAREFSKADLELVRAIWHYLKEGFKHRVAYEKALADLKDGENQACSPDSSTPEGSYSGAGNGWTAHG